jgi:hypothetical protein
MTISELLSQFRALGGIAENISIRQCAHGHGLFAVNPNQPVRLVTPVQLLISPTLLRVTSDGHIKVKSASGLSVAVTAFHEHYQRTLSWGAGGLGYINQHRQQLCALSDSLKTFLQILGCRDDLSLQLTPREAFHRHCISRQISVQGVSMLMPMLELANHSDEGAPYVVMQDGVSLSGKFDDEVVARYRHHMDAFHFFFNYHFAKPSRTTLSCDVKIDIPGFRSLRISRLDGLSEARKAYRVPQVSTSKNEIHLSFVELVNLDEPNLPRQVFLELLMEQGIPMSSVNQIFDGLLGHNREVLQDFLKACVGAEGLIIQNLRTIAAYQLANLR